MGYVIGDFRHFSMLLPQYYLCLRFIPFDPGFPIGGAMFLILFELKTIIFELACHLLAVFAKLCIFICWICWPSLVQWILFSLVVMFLLLVGVIILPFYRLYIIVHFCYLLRHFFIEFCAISSACLLLYFIWLSCSWCCC